MPLYERFARLEQNQLRSRAELNALTLQDTTDVLDAALANVQNFVRIYGGARLSPGQARLGGWIAKNGLPKRSRNRIFGVD